MKSLLITLTLVATVYVTTFAQSAIPNHTRRTQKEAFSSNNLLENKERVYNYYNTDGNLVETNIERWDGVEWQPYGKNFYTLNTAGKTTKILFTVLNLGTGSYDNNYRNVYTYNDQGLEEQFTEEVYKDTGWELTIDGNTYYSPTNKVIESTTFYYENGQIIQGFRYIKTYNNIDLLETSISQNYQTGGQWQNVSKEVFEYVDTDDLPETKSTQNWVIATNAWSATVAKSTFTYTPSQDIILIENAVNGIFTILGRTKIDKDINGQTVNFLFEKFQPITSTWSPNNGYQLDYNPDQSVHQYRYYFEDFITSTYFLTTLIDYEYDNFSASQTPVSQTQIDVFPNPTTDFIHVNMRNSNAVETQLTLSNAQGQVIAKYQLSSNSTQISLNNQLSGIYFLQIEQDGATKVVPIIKG
jgi:hypothetical protein